MLYLLLFDGLCDKLFWFLCGWFGGFDYYISWFGYLWLCVWYLLFLIVLVECD